MSAHANVSEIKALWESKESAHLVKTSQMTWLLKRRQNSHHYKAQAQGQEIALENTCVPQHRINSVLSGGNVRGRLQQQNKKEGRVVEDLRMSAEDKESAEPAPSDPDLYSKEAGYRRRVGTGYILHSAAPGRPRLKVVWHLCHVGPGMVWAGGQGQGNICNTSECLATCPH